ncbi:MAG: beta-barrel assembly machine subunit BamF [Phenylobacterium zucineum]|nr:MAG: beta-barrel assembly machine subunit BamF [Phenylobacterium zucineum]
MRLNQVIITTAVLCAAGLAGCASTQEALGMSKVVPDEFRVVSKAPLVVPPDYALRPPAPGEPRPQELQPESAARTALLGQRQAEDRSGGETLLVTKAGADKADPLIRFVVDDENGDIAHKDKSFSDKVMFWKKGTATPVISASAGDNVPAPIDPAVEAAKIKALIGDKPVIIAREKSSRLKLPGL